MFKGRKTHVQKHAISQSDTAVWDIYSLRGTEVRGLLSGRLYWQLPYLVLRYIAGGGRTEIGEQRDTI